MTDARGGREHNLLDDSIQMTEATAKHLIDRLDRAAAHSPVRRIRDLTRSHVVGAILGSVGFALFIVGVERVAQDVPVISNGWGSIAVGLLLLVATGGLLARLSGRE